MTKFLSQVMFILLILIITDSIVFGAGKEEAASGLAEMKVGLLLHDVATRVNKHEDGVDLSIDLYFQSPDNRPFNIMGNPRPMIGASLHSGNDTHQFYGGLAWTFKADESVFISFEFGGAVHTGETDSSDPDKQRLGSSVLFRLAAGFGFIINDDWNLALYFTHISNAGLSDPNNGLETFGLKLGYLF